MYRREFLAAVIGAIGGPRIARLLDRWSGRDPGITIRRAHTFGPCSRVDVLYGFDTSKLSMTSRITHEFLLALRGSTLAAMQRVNLEYGFVFNDGRADRECAPSLGLLRVTQAVRPADELRFHAHAFVG
jgi:hypothetical protein